MKIYQLKQRPEEFKTLTLDIMNLANQLGNKKLVRQLRLQPSTNEPLLPIWKDGVVGDFEDVLGKNSTMPDISTWYSTYLALTAGACDKLESVLASEGEFLPINVGDETIYAFNCLSFGAEDESMCLKKHTDGFEDGLETIEFDEEDIEPRYVFKSRLQGCTVLYATESFKLLCEEHGLEGLKFDEDLLDPF
ncbi:hypothetical protein J4H27_06035 [Vibrio alginolyticus]|uniref:hypothetical protein n=1 Tax=Vibrio TaxID=662 RepID=UPI00045F1671|nr:MULTISPECIES: hypothetical protein [Vibrio]MDG2625823.1 hypothetical protein [Vibrio parahaemolyticus]MDW2294344.1 hypothetical protein [Vibrio sp. 1404]GAK15717.1 hypothetical protein JCM19053_1025 [Vibrio sp. JCM 19053]AVF72739.1 hypothetical protein AL539_02955 [Vibrio alginolyticus]EGQ7901231.1 hypothetical protein [Vibrio alginolyticus]